MRRRGDIISGSNGGPIPGARGVGSRSRGTADGTKASRSSGAGPFPATAGAVTGGGTTPHSRGQRLRSMALKSSTGGHMPELPVSRPRPMDGFLAPKPRPRANAPSATSSTRSSRVTAAAKSVAIGHAPAHSLFPPTPWTPKALWTSIYRDWDNITQRTRGYEQQLAQYAPKSPKASTGDHDALPPAKLPAHTLPDPDLLPEPLRSHVKMTEKEARKLGRRGLIVRQLRRYAVSRALDVASLPTPPRFLPEVVQDPPEDASPFEQYRAIAARLSLIGSGRPSTLSLQAGALLNSQYNYPSTTAATQRIIVEDATRTNRPEPILLMLRGEVGTRPDHATIPATAHAHFTVSPGVPGYFPEGRAYRSPFTSIAHGTRYAVSTSVHESATTRMPSRDVASVDDDEGEGEEAEAEVVGAKEEKKGEEKKEEVKGENGSKRGSRSKKSLLKKTPPISSSSKASRLVKKMLKPSVALEKAKFRDRERFQREDDGIGGGGGSGLPRTGGYLSKAAVERAATRRKHERGDTHGQERGYCHVCGTCFAHRTEHVLSKGHQAKRTSRKPWPQQHPGPWSRNLPHDVEEESDEDEEEIFEPAPSPKQEILNKQNQELSLPPSTLRWEGRIRFNRHAKDIKKEWIQWQQDLESYNAQGRLRGIAGK